MELKEVTEFEGGSEVMWIFTKGTVGKSDFIEAYFQKYNGRLEENDIEYTIARYIPAGPDIDYPVIHFNQTPGRGAFKITYIDLSRF